LHDTRQFWTGDAVDKAGIIFDQIGRRDLPADILPSDEQR
jgi:hypothetical protein